jgi:hypothetical protein
MEKLFREKYGFLPVEVSQKISTYILPQLERKAQAASASETP